jgi:regulatory protein YycH of two-component signal transduction system YycFG
MSKTQLCTLFAVLSVRLTFMIWLQSPHVQYEARNELNTNSQTRNFALSKESHQPKTEYLTFTGGPELVKRTLKLGQGI